MIVSSRPGRAPAWAARFLGSGPLAGVNCFHSPISHKKFRSATPAASQTCSCWQQSALPLRLRPRSAVGTQPYRCGHELSAAGFRGRFLRTLRQLPVASLPPPLRHHHAPAAAPRLEHASAWRRSHAPHQPPRLRHPCLVLPNSASAVLSVVAALFEFVIPR